LRHCGGAVDFFSLLMAVAVVTAAAATVAVVVVVVVVLLSIGGTPLFSLLLLPPLLLLLLLPPILQLPMLPRVFLLLPHYHFLCHPLSSLLASSALPKKPYFRTQRHHRLHRRLHHRRRRRHPQLPRRCRRPRPARLGCGPRACPETRPSPFRDTPEPRKLPEPPGAVELWQRLVSRRGRNSQLPPWSPGWFSLQHPPPLLRRWRSRRAVAEGSPFTNRTATKG